MNHNQEKQIDINGEDNCYIAMYEYDLNQKIIENEWENQNYQQ